MLDDFIKKISKVNSEIGRLEEYTNKFSELYNRKLRNVLTSDEEKEITLHIDSVGDLFKRHSRSIKEELESIAAENKLIREKVSESSLKYQSRHLHWQRCTKKLSEEINRFRKEQLKYTQDEKNKLKSQYAVINPGAKDEEITELLSNENSDSILQNALAGCSDSSRRHLEDAKIRNIKIRSLTKKLDELLELINELQSMVNNSGMIIDKIEVQMAGSRVNTESANRDLESAYKYQVRTMWLKRIFGLLFMLIVLIFGTFIFIRIVEYVNR